MRICKNCLKDAENIGNSACECGGVIKDVEPSPFKEKRYGMFQVHERMLMAHYDEVLKLLTPCFMTKVEYIYHANVFVITAVHPNFLKMKEGSMPDTYNICYAASDNEFYFRNTKDMEEPKQ